jgi:hypothetical protein
VDPRAGLDVLEMRKFLTLPGLELRPISRPQPVANRYTDCAITAPIIIIFQNKILINICLVSLHITNAYYRHKVHYNS